MEKPYREKGGSAESFNGVNVQLVTEDLDRLEAGIKASRLPHTEGLFFGASERDDDLNCIEKVRAALVRNMRVFYSSWW
jgi:hypothetical protein